MLLAHKRVFFIWFIFVSIHSQAVTYYWVGGNNVSGLWGMSGNWSLTLGGMSVGSITTSNSDYFIFDGSDISSNQGLQSGSILFTISASETIGLLQVVNFQNSGKVTLQSNTSGARTLTISPINANTDFLLVDSVSTLIVKGNASRKTTLIIEQNAIAKVYGLLQTNIGIAGLGQINASANSLIFESTSTYDHNQNGGVLPTAIWKSGSYCKVSGVTTTAPTGLFGQSFSNLIWYSQNQNSAALLSNSTGASLMVADTFMVLSTGSDTLTLRKVSKNYSCSFGHFRLGNAKLKIQVPVSTGSFTIENGGRIELQNSQTLQISGNWVNAGTFVANTGTVSLAGFGLQSISNTNSGTESFYNLTLGGSGTKSISPNTNVDILPSGTLMLGSGITFDLSDRTLTLKSGVSVSDNLDNTARLAAVPGGASFANASNFKVERYIPSGKRTVRFLSSPVTGAKVSDWANAFYVTGKKAVYPDNAVLSSTVSTVSDYTETLNGLSSQKFTEVHGLETTLVPGKGYRAFVRGGRDIDTNPAIAPFATATTLCATGEPNVGNVTANLTYTNHSKPDEDGWNLVGNPYASQIDWTLISSNDRLNVPNTFSVFDPRLGSNGGYYSYSSGVGTPNRANPSIIPSSQAFFVKLKAAGSGSITFKESQKTSNGHTVNYRTSEDNLLRISIYDTAYSDETVLHLLEGTSDGFDDDFDAPKFPNTGVNIYTQEIGGKKLAINRVSIDANVSVPLGISNNYKGQHKLKFVDNGSFVGKKLYLKDNYLGTVTEIMDGVEYFFITNNDTNSAGSGRFLLTDLRRENILTNTVSGHELIATKIFPNPTRGRSFSLLASTSNIETTEFQILKLEGILLSNIVPNLVQNYNDLNSFQFVLPETVVAGVYLLKSDVGGKTSIQRFIVSDN